MVYATIDQNKKHNIFFILHPPYLCDIPTLIALKHDFVPVRAKAVFVHFLTDCPQSGGTPVYFFTVKVHRFDGQDFVAFLGRSDDKATVKRQFDFHCPSFSFILIFPFIDAILLIIKVDFVSQCGGIRNGSIWMPPACRLSYEQGLGNVSEIAASLELQSSGRTIGQSAFYMPEIRHDID